MIGSPAHRETARGQLPGAAVIPVHNPQLVTVATVRKNATVITRTVGDVFVEIMLDTGSAVSLLRHSEAKTMKIRPSLQNCSSIQLVTASGESLPIVDCVDAPIQMTDTFTTTHQFLVVDSLIYPVILGTDFLYKHHLCLEFTSSPVTVQHNKSQIESV